MIEAYVGLARYNEYGLQEGGLMGDQLQTSTPDSTGELATIPLAEFLEGSSGATIYRIKDIEQSNKMGKGIIKACDNPYIGYDTNNRYSILAYGIFSGHKNGKPAECDNASLIRVVIKYASDIDPGDFTNASARRVLEDSGLFLEPIKIGSDSPVYLGDIIIRDDNNLLSIVGIGDPRPVPSPGTGGTNDYNELINKPSINGTTLKGDKSTSELKVNVPTVDGEVLVFH